MKKLKIFSIVFLLICIAVLSYLRFIQSDNNEIVVDDFTISGLKTGIAVECNKSAGGIFISIPNSVKMEDVIAVSSDNNIGYLKLNLEEPYNTRILEAEMIAVSPGLVEVGVQSSDGKICSETFIINCTPSSEAEVDVTKEAVTSTDAELSENTVFVTPKGSKYHLSESCAGNSGYAVSFDDIVAEKYSPCKKCALKY